ncbi:MAG: TolC family protein [Cryomorphaceae bacterium]|nr:MAG: TolC family protein [Cryomorphaceae bacterium]
MKPLQIAVCALFLAGMQPAVAQQDPVRLSLEEAQKYALKHAYSLDYADMEVRAASYRNRELTAIGLPQINGDISFTNYLDLPTTVLPANAFNPAAPEDELVGVRFGTDYTSTASLRASQLIFDGTYFVGLKAAKTYVRLNQYGLEQSKNELRKNVTEAYALAAMASEAVQVLKDNMKSLESLLAETEKLFDSGFREELDVNQLQLQFSSLKNAVRQAERNVDITRNLLKFQIGMPVATPLELSTTLDELADVSYMPMMLERDVKLQGHTDILTNETNVQLRELNVRAERMAGAPNLGGVFTAQQQAFRNDMDFFSANSDWFPNTFWGLQLNVPIFSGFMRHNKVQQAKVEVERAKRQLEQVREGLELEIATQRANFASAMEVYNTEKENVALAEKIFNTTTRKYQEGLSGSFELQQAETQMLNAQSSFLQSAYEVITAKAALEKALDIQP